MAKYQVTTAEGVFEVETEDTPAPDPRLSDRAGLIPQGPIDIAATEGKRLKAGLFEPLAEGITQLPGNSTLAHIGKAALATVPAVAGELMPTTPGQVVATAPGEFLGPIVKSGLPIVGKSIANKANKFGEGMANSLWGSRAYRSAQQGLGNFLGKFGSGKSSQLVGEEIKRGLENTYGRAEGALSEAQQKVIDEKTGLFNQAENQKKSLYERSKELEKNQFSEIEKQRQSLYEGSKELEKNQFSEDILNKQKQLKGHFDNIVNEMGVRDVGPGEAGQQAKSKFEDYIGKLRSNADANYRELDKVAGGKTADATATRQHISDIFAQQGIEDRPLPGFLKDQDVIRQLTDQGLTEEQALIALKGTVETQGLVSSIASKKTVSGFKPLNDLMNVLDNPKLTVADLNKKASEIGRIAYGSSIDEGTRGIYKSVYASLREDAANAAEKGGFGKIADDARNSWRIFKQVEEHPVAKAIRGSNPEDVVGKIVGKESTSKIKDAIAMMGGGEEGANIFRGRYLSKLKEFSGNDPSEIAGGLKDMSEETKQVLWGKHKPLIDDYIKFNDEISKSNKFVSSIEKPEPLKFLSSIEKPVAGEAPVINKGPIFPAGMEETSKLIRGRPAREVIESLLSGKRESIGSNILETYRIVDENGKNALRKGIIDYAFENSRNIGKETSISQKKLSSIFDQIPDDVIKKVYGKDAGVVFSVRDIAAHQGDNLSKSILEDAYNIFKIWGIKSGIKSIYSKATAGSAVDEIVGKYLPEDAAKEAGKMFFPLRTPEFFKASARPGIEKTGYQTGRMGLQMPLTNEQ